MKQLSNEKSVEFNGLTWYLLRILNLNISHKVDYDKFIWKPVLSKGIFKDFEQPPLNSSVELRKEIESLQDYQSELLDKLAKKENEYNRLNLQTVKLINKKKGDTNTIQEKLIERLKEDNKNLQVALQDIQTGNNMLGINYAISLIHEDLNDSDFIDEDNFDEILTEMTKQLSISNSKAQSSIHNNRSSSNTNNQLRSSFEKLISEIALNPNTKSILSNILKQVSFSDEEIYQLIGKKGGTISLPK